MNRYSFISTTSHSPTLTFYEIFGYYKSSFIVFFSTNVFSCIFIFILWTILFDKKIFNSSKKKQIINRFFFIYLIFIFFIVFNFVIFKILLNDFFFNNTLTWGLNLIKRFYISISNSYWNINFISINISFFFSVLTFLFFNSCIYKIYINKEKWNYNKIYFIPLILIAQIALITLIFAKNFVVIYTSIELFSMVIYYIIIFESINNKIEINSNVYNTELSLKYFVISLFGSINILIGISFIFYSIGCIDFHILSMYFLPSTEGMEYFSGTGIKFGFILFIIGILIKMGIAPYHFWINGIYDRFSNTFFEYMSIFPKSIIICFILNLFSCLTICYPNDGILSINNFFSIIGICNIIFGTFSSINQTDLKRIIMYSSLSNIGYVFLAMGANYFTVSAAYSYIIHYTLALFILFRVLNYVEIKQKITFKQWYFAEFSVLTLKNKVFMTIAIFNLSGLPPFTLFFNKFFILSHLWNYEAYFSFFIMIIFSVISYSYYFNIIKFIWFNEKFSKNTAKSHFYKDFKLRKFFFNQDKDENLIKLLSWDLVEDIEEKLVIEKGKFLYKDYHWIAESSSIYEDWVKNFCFSIEKVITRIFLFSSFIGFFSVIYFITWIDYFFKLDFKIKFWIPIWRTDKDLWKQIIFSARGLVTTKKKIIQIKSDIYSIYFNKISMKFDFFSSWANFYNYTSKNLKNKYIIRSYVNNIHKVSTLGNGDPASIDEHSPVIFYIINKYFINNLSTAILVILIFYVWISRGTFRNFLLGLTLIENAIHRTIQVILYYVTAGAITFIALNYSAIKHYSRDQKPSRSMIKTCQFLEKYVFIVAFIVLGIIIKFIIYNIWNIMVVILTRRVIQYLFLTEKLGYFSHFENYITDSVKLKIKIKKEYDEDNTLSPWNDDIKIYKIK